MDIYAIPGEVMQHVGKAPTGAVLMECVNPGGYTAQEDGTWAKGTDIVKQEAKATMAATLEKGFTYYGVTYQCRDVDMVRWQQGLTLIDLMGLTSIDARAMDNSMHTLTAESYRELCAAAAAAYNAALTTYWETVDG